jgi:hypothetical protein
MFRTYLIEYDSRNKKKIIGNFFFLFEGGGSYLFVSFVCDSKEN